MSERTGRDASSHVSRTSGRLPRRRRLLEFDPLEGRSLLTAALATIAPITVPAGLGSQVPLDGSASGVASQTFTVTSSNPVVKATIAQGKFLTINVQHSSAGANDPAFSGSMVFQLFEDLTPISAASIENLVTSGFYTNKNFHRISSGFPDATGFIAQGGSVNGAGQDSPPAQGQPGGLPATGYPFVDEYNLQLVYDGSGQLALANAGNDTNTSQFFITTSTPRSLDFNKTIFGQLVSGQAILTDLTHVALGGSSGTTPINAVTITSATLSNVNPDGVVHVDATGAAQGATSVLTVTATDPTTSTQAKQSFAVTVGATNPPTTVNPFPERPFISSYPTNVTVGNGQTAVFKIGVTDVVQNASLSYTVQGGLGAGGSTFTALQNATGTVDSNGVFTIVPNAGFSGTISVLVGVRDQTDRTGGSGLNSASNYDTHVVTLTVNSSPTPVTQTPIALPVSVSAAAGAPTTVQLSANSANPGTNPALTFAIVSQPAHGTLTNLNASTGTVTYTPSGTFVGTDTFTYNVSTTGLTPNLTSTPATVTIAVASGNTGAVRLIGNVLVVTPPARFDHKGNTIKVDEVGGQVQVTVNGILDSTQPQASTLTGIIVYGSKNSDTIQVTPAVNVVTLLDGGHGGLNFIKAGGADSRIHGWFGRNTVQGGSGTNNIVGRLGHLRVIKSSGTDSVFLSGIDPANRYPQLHNAHFFKPHKKPSLGNFYKFVGNKLVKTKQPASVKFTQG
jgi:cyclophilin family peptidyl-prolyl cis-trans isomerase